MATISDVAKKAGVSKATVSRVINGISVRDETRQSVIEAIKELGYRPNAHARSLTSGRASVVGVLVPSVESPFYGAILGGCQRALLSYSYNMIVCSTYHRRGNEWTFTKLMWERRVDGLLILTPREIEDRPMKQLLQETTKKGFPIVVADGLIESQISAVWIDNFRGGYQATEHLIDLGHRRIGIVLGPKDTTESVHRFNGYKRALKDHGLSFDESLLAVAGSYDREASLSVVPNLLDNDITAVFAANDDLAIGVMEVCRKRGISIPDQLSVIGYDDVLYAGLVSPGLTTVRQPLQMLGDIAARKLVKTITGEEPQVTQITLPTELIIRESTGSCA